MRYSYSERRVCSVAHDKSKSVSISEAAQRLWPLRRRRLRRLVGREYCKPIHRHDTYGGA